MDHTQTEFFFWQQANEQISSAGYMTFSFSYGITFTYLFFNCSYRYSCNKYLVFVIKYSLSYKAT